jgi:hypothetical protein
MEVHAAREGAVIELGADLSPSNEI